MYGEEVLLFQLLVTHHLLAQVTHLQIGRTVAQCLCQCLEHQTEELVARILVVVILTFAQHAAVDE